MRRTTSMAIGDSGNSFFGGLAARILLDIGHGEERSARMHPTRRFQDWTGLPVWEI